MKNKVSTLSITLGACFVSWGVLSQLGASEETYRQLEHYVIPSQENAAEPVANLSSTHRSDSVPASRYQGTDDLYLEGYIQALVDMHYHEYKIQVLVKGSTVFLANLPKNESLAQSVIAFVSDFPEVKKVEVVRESEVKKLFTEHIFRQEYTEVPKVSGEWFPQTTILFEPLIADPRQVRYAIGMRWHDHAIGARVMEASLGDSFPVYRWFDLWPCHGDLQIAIEAGAWTVLDQSKSSFDLINADYMAAIPVTYAFGKWSFRLRPYHMSSHLGDEYIMHNHITKAQRKNKSFEAVDITASYQWNRYLRLYAGPGFIIKSDRQMPLKNYYVQYGAEIHCWGHRFLTSRLYGEFFLAAYISHFQYLHWNPNLTMAIGYQLNKLQGTGRGMRIYLEYHNGHSAEGQFATEITKYIGIKLSYGF